ncbi:DoxX family protein [Ectothiorhodospiraceae bacterium 2226]|nr:DoxX family protein [Ectothiorhodospiraceae bacterium 2226]
MNYVTDDDVGKLILRLVLGILVLMHGIAKLVGGVGSIAGMLQGIGLPGALAYLVFIGEVVAPIMVILGYYARIGAGLIFINMIVAILLAHPAELLALTPHGGWALELQGMFLFTALALVFMRPGRFSLNGR